MQALVERPESYVVEIDGKFGSTHGVFAEAFESWSGIETEVSAQPNQSARRRI